MNKHTCQSYYILLELSFLLLPGIGMCNKVFASWQYYSQYDIAFPLTDKASLTDKVIKVN